MNMQIGITERGDAGRDLRWTCTINQMDGAVLITKAITPDFINAVLACKKPLIIHCTCTGYGGTTLEPGAPTPSAQLHNLKCLIDAGFPASRAVLRIDPIFPTEKGLAHARAVLDAMLAMQLGIKRIRISIVDEYPHVRERYAERGWTPIYGGKFSPSKAHIQKLADMLYAYKDSGLHFETCAEPALVQTAHNMGIFNIAEVGCISKEDLWLMGLPMPNGLTTNPQNRSGCKCLSCKTEMLATKMPCSHGCIYCFWKDKGKA